MTRKRSTKGSNLFDGTTEVEPWGEPVVGAALLDELALMVSRYVVLPAACPEALALWILHTYAFELRDVTSYLGLESPEKRCGKTTLLEVLCELVNRPVVAANISSSAFFRVIEEVRPTLLIDEADTFLQGNEELRGILNSGYSRKTAFVVRVASQEADLAGQKPEEGTSRLVKFSCWCPKVMATIGRLPDTLADRRIVVRMQRKTAQETCERLRNLDGTTLRRRCVRFALDHAGDIARARPEIPPALNDRAADIWEPLLALADLAGGEWPAKARQAAASLTAGAVEHNPIGALLLDILAIFVLGKTDRIFSRILVELLDEGPDRPWSDLRKGKKLTELWLAQRLRPFGVRPRTVWMDGISAKGYDRADFVDIWPRYISRAELEAFKAEKALDAERAPKADATHLTTKGG